jgi:hypothetical protein
LLGISDVSETSTMNLLDWKGKFVTRSTPDKEAFAAKAYVALRSAKKRLAFMSGKTGGRGENGGSYLCGSRDLFSAIFEVARGETLICECGSSLA